jgi:stage IV sporulation protein B
VRDSTAGIGTLSFYDPDLSAYAALGHAITDVDTRSSLSVRAGEVYQANIIDVVQGIQGEPGELRGTFSMDGEALGDIRINTEDGIYGKLYGDYKNEIYTTPLLLARPDEAVTGEALLLSTTGTEGVKVYTCRIIKVNPQTYPAPKGMVIEVTDEELLRTTGGIVQGMSGSPIIQKGKLVGVVTHVFINDPTKGYCMYAQWMHEQMKANIPAA